MCGSDRMVFKDAQCIHAFAYQLLFKICLIITFCQCLTSCANNVCTRKTVEDKIFLVVTFVFLFF